MICYYCGEIIDDKSRTKEHVILASLGGSLTSYDILCRQCNSELGSSIDNELFSQLEFASIYLGFSNNPLHMQTAIDEKLVVGKGFKPYSRGANYIPNSDSHVHFWRKDTKEILKILGENLTNIKKKYNNLSLRIEEYEETNADKLFYLKQKNTTKPGEIMFGGENYFHAITKMAVGFASMRKVPLQYLQEAINSIKGNGKIMSDYFYPTTYSVREKDPEEISHLMYLKGDSEKKILFVYSELFSFCNHICVLNNAYDGEEIEDIYHFDLISKQLITDTKIKININKTFGQQWRVITQSMFENNQKQQFFAFNNFMKLLEKRQLL